MVSCTYPEGEKHVFYFYENQFVDAVHRPDYKGNFACGPKRENTEKEFQPLQFVYLFVVVVCSCSVSKLCLILCDPTDCSMSDFLSFTVSSSLLKLLSIDSVMPSNHLILCCPLLFMPSIFPNIRSLSNVSTLRIKVLEFQLQHQSFQ